MSVMAMFHQLKRVSLLRSKSPVRRLHIPVAAGPVGCFPVTA